VTNSKAATSADLSHTAMNAALADGTAHYLSETIRDFARYQESWWIFDRTGWWQVTRLDASAGLDLMAQNMRLADEAVRRKTAG
jgi:hypothetical protein